MQAGFFDQLIPFNGNAVWIYMSIYLLMPIGPFLMNKRTEIARYAMGIVLIGALADIVFIFWPTVCPRPDPAGTVFAYRTLVMIDNPFHACPSLHGAFAIFSALCAGRVLREMQKGFLWHGCVWLWAMLILLATLLTKQHMLADIVAGSALGCCAYFCVFHQAKTRSKAKLPIQTTSRYTTQSQSNLP